MIQAAFTFIYTLMQLYHFLSGAENEFESKDFVVETLRHTRLPEEGKTHPIGSNNSQPTVVSL